MFDYVLSAFVTLFVTIDPVGLAPIFIVLTTGMAGSARRQAAIRSTLLAGGVLIAFALVGEPLIGFLGISLAAFGVAGGLLLFAIAFEMVFDIRGSRKAAAAESASGYDVRHVATFPLAIPLISGPAAISATILLSSRASSGWALTLLLIIIAALMGACLAVFMLAGQIERFLGDMGRIVLSRLLGILLAALAVQFVADGVMAIVRTGTGA